jgi:hypothetical protein
MQTAYDIDLKYVFEFIAMIVETRPATKGRNPRMLRNIRSRFRGLTAPADSGVHFHQGPQGQPAPCFDDRCESPRLSV